MELMTTCILRELYKSERKYNEAKGLDLKALKIAEGIGDREIEAECYASLGSIFVLHGEYVKAKEHFEKALAIAEKIGDRETEARCYVSLGSIFVLHGEYVKAKEHFEKALAIAEKIGDRETEARCYVSLGSIFESLGEYVKAKEHSEKALAIAEKIGDRETEAKCYVILGGIFEHLGERVKAKEHWEKVLAIAEKIGDRETEAKCYVILGGIFEHLGEHVKAKEHSEEALAIAQKIGDRETEAKCYVILGGIFGHLGDYVKAKEHSEKALAIAQKIGDRETEAKCYVFLGGIFGHLGEYVKAKEHSEKALAIAEKIGDREIEAECYASLGSIFVSLGEYVKAKEHSEKSLVIAEKIGDRKIEAKCYASLGHIFVSLGEYVKAKEHSEKSLVIAEKIGDREIEAECYASVGQSFASLGEYVKAKELLEKSIVLFKKCGIIEFESLLHLVASMSMFLEGNISEAKSNAVDSFNSLELMRRLQVHDKFKISYFDRMASAYRVFSHFLCIADFPYEAFYTEEFGRARALTDLMTALYSVENEIPVSPRTWDDVQSIVKKECDCSCLYISYYKQLIHLWVVKAGNPLIHRQMKVNDVFGSVRRVADLLCLAIYREVLCLAPEQCEDRSWLPSNVYWEQGCERPIWEDDEKIVEDEDENQQPELTLADLYKMIIAPVTDSLNEPEIIIVPDRLFYKVPFAALEEESGKCLSESFRIRIVPSLTTLKLIQDCPEDYHSQTGVLIVGDPHVGEVSYNGKLRQVSRLPFANREAEMIGKLFGTQPLVGKQATKQAVLQNIHSVSLIHFACHGNAERGEILLAPPPLTDRKPQEEDYLLTMQNISKVQLRAKLVVLSCCHSAKGQISGEGVVGIARAFLGSGARSVLAALWAIEDEPTEQFMSRFYESLVRGKSASESLQQTMKWMRENGLSKVTQWAPFMLFGDNVTLDIHKLKSSKGQ
ncbi:unnamed protein product [Porites evermanni]|uniref:Tetratricopeptide repeat protein 28 n=1 Tax=Porites evermanni TaxID=104178 RepID=A0ABN8LJ55_9CNID|nr:unnamed protein product [Porites evermanni]